MLKSNAVMATLAVKDMAKANEFYESKLGLKKTEEEEGAWASYESGDSVVFIYKSDFAGTNKAIAATWVVGDEVDKIVEALKSKDIVFEHYKDMADTKLEGDIHVSGTRRVAWLKDPDNNILCLVNG
jgi:catechol 2,3-dioxygenase-like lactoylglutathione lyase family enzyme